MLFIFSTPVLIRYLWQLKTVVFLHWCLICAVLLYHYCSNVVITWKIGWVYSNYTNFYILANVLWSGIAPSTQTLISLCEPTDSWKIYLILLFLPENVFLLLIPPWKFGWLSNICLTNFYLLENVLFVTDSSLKILVIWQYLFW